MRELDPPSFWRSASRNLRKVRTLNVVARQATQTALPLHCVGPSYRVGPYDCSLQGQVGRRSSGQRSRKESGMATEQLPVIVGEWYWGVRCPECGAMAAHIPD